MKMEPTLGSTDPHADFARALMHLSSSWLKSVHSYPAKYMVAKVKQMSLRKLWSSLSHLRHLLNLPFSMVFSVIIMMPAAPTEVVTTEALVYTSHKELSTFEYCSLLISHTLTVLPIESIFSTMATFPIVSRNLNFNIKFLPMIFFWCRWIQKIMFLVK